MKINTGVLFRIVQKEMLHIVRGNLLFLLIAPPLIQTIVFGYVVTTEVKHISTLIVNRDTSRHSQELIDKFSHTEYFTVKAFSTDQNDVQRMMTKGQVKCALLIPPDFSSNIKKGKNARVQFITDGSDSSVGGIAVSYSAIIIANFAKEVLGPKIRQIETRIGHIPEVTTEERIWFNPELKSMNTMIPGVIGMILLIVTTLVSSLALVREKEYGNIEQLVVTPVKPYELLIGKIIPYVAVGFIDIILITAAGLLVFQVPFKGSFFLLLCLSLAAVVVNLGVGVFISTISSTQQQAMVSSMLVMITSVLLSGLIFPIQNMPVFFQYLTYAMPLRYYLEVLRGIFLKGLTFQELLPQTLILIAYAVLIFSAAIKKFKKTVG